MGIDGERVKFRLMKRSAKWDVCIGPCIIRDQTMTQLCFRLALKKGTEALEEGGISGGSGQE